jgi:hypothetical protein
LIKKQSKKYIVFLIIFAFMLYLFLFPFSLEKEFALNPQWTLDITVPIENGTVIDKISPVTWFKQGNQPGDIFGYFNLAGNLLYKENIIFNVTLSEKYFINYSSVPSNLVLKQRDGEIIMNYNTSGYPLLSNNGNRLFFFNTDALGFREFNLEGEELWNTYVMQNITSFTGNDEYVICGLLNGVLDFYYKDNDKKFAISPGGSKIDVIYGCTLNRTGNAFAGISGIATQRLFYGEIQEDGPVISFFKNLDSDLRRELKIAFSESGKYLFFEGENAINIIDTTSKDMVKNNLKADIFDFSYNDELGLLSVITKHENDYDLSLIKPLNSVMFQEKINAEKLFLKLMGEYFLLVKDDFLICIKIMEI